jgi:hypothetical protein
MHAVARISAAHPAESPHAARALWAIGFVAALGTLVVACLLHPDPSGFGTHTQLGLPPCLFRAITSLPCPTCGLTTAFAHMARLQITSALHSHPLGPLLFALDALAVPLTLVGFTRAWPINLALRRLRAGELAVIISLAVLLVWVARLSAILPA